MIQLTKEEIEVLSDYYANRINKLDDRYVTLHEDATGIVDENVKQIQLDVWLTEINRLNLRYDQIMEENEN